MKKKQLVRIIAMVIAVLLAVGMVGGSLFYIFAADESQATVADEAIITAESATYVNEVPLLILLVSFDADGDGINDWNTDIPDKLYSDTGSQCYGEQWAGTSPEDHYDRYFGKGKNSLYDYFLETSCGRFTYVPAQFDAPKEDFKVKDGIINVTLNAMHPTAYYVKHGEVESVTYLLYCKNLIAEAIDAVDEYINFAKFDRNNDHRVDETELGLLMISSGGDRSTSSPTTYKMESNPKYYFQVHSAATAINTVVDDVRIAPRKDCNVASIGEYYSKGEVMTIGAAAHELAHTLGAEDLYHTGGEFGGDASADATWPQPYNFSLQCNGSQLDSGNTPSYLDPYQRIKLGWVTPTVVNKDGEYTLYSTKSGKYNVLLVQTPDEDEYFLVEIRMRDGFDECIASGESKGGIIVWHIDDGINKKYYQDGYACTAVPVDGEIHDPGIVPLFRTGWNLTGNRMANTTPSDPFFYRSEEAGTAVFNSMSYCSATKGSVSLNSYPDNWENGKGFNVRIEALSEPGDEMKIKLTTSEEKLLPRTTALCSARSINSITVVSSIEKIYEEMPTGCGIIISSDSNPTIENGKKIDCKLDDDLNFYALFDGLEQEKKYYYIAFVRTASGTTCSNIYSTSTLAEKTYFYFRMHKNITDGEKATEVRGYADKPLSYSFPMVKEGYVLGGWYTDEALTKPYDMSFTKKDIITDIDLYARWIPEAEAVIPEIIGAETKYPVFAVKVGEKLTAPSADVLGWYSDEACKTPFDFGAIRNTAGKIKIYALKSAETTTTSTTATTAATTVTTVESTTSTTSVTATETTSTADTSSTVATTSATTVTTTASTSTTSTEATSSLLATTEPGSESSSKEVMIIMIIALAVLAVAFITALLFVKKK